MGINGAQLKALLYKEYLTYKKSFISFLLVQIIIPVAMGYLLLVYAPSTAEQSLSRFEKRIEEQLNSSRIFQQTLHINEICNFRPSVLYFHPKTNVTENVMKNVKKKCHLLNPILIESEAILNKTLAAITANRMNVSYDHIIGAVIFRNVSKHYLNYELRPVDFDDYTETDLYNKQYSRGSVLTYLTRNPYLKSKFTAMQIFINKAFIEMVSLEIEHANNDTDTNAYEEFEVVMLSKMKDIDIFKKMPVIESLNIYYTALVSTILPLMIFLKSVLDEKNSQMKKLLKLMAMRELEYWLAKCFFVILVFIFLGAYNVFLIRLQTEDRVDVSLIFVILLIYFLSSMFLAMAVSTICNVAIIGIAAFLAIGFLSSVPFWFFLKPPGGAQWIMFQGRTYIPELVYLLMCVIVPPNFSLICSLMLVIEGNNYAYSSKYLSSYTSFAPRWWHLFEVTPSYKLLSLGMVMMASMASTVLWFLVFLLLVKLIGIDPDVIPHLQESESSPKIETKYFESEPKQLKSGIFINNLTKRFSGKEVVKNLSLNLYYGQITVLLGHNGAGKSTLMNMITGLTEPSSGQIFVNGFDVIRNKKMMQGKVGLCPQKEILFENFTVEEHLYIFAILKGYPSKDIANEITRVLKLLNLTEKRRIRALSLSVGMRRKLQFGISIVGGCNILILDEPSSGLDVESRRLIWDLLRSLRKTFLIFMTTHHMEEADCLADRVVVMADGHLLCSGSTPYLKRVFNVGHHLRILSEAQDKSPITNFVSNNCTEAKLESITLNEIVFKIPLIKAEKLQDLCQKLEKESNNIEVRSFGLTATPLDDVFLNSYLLFKEERQPSISNVSQSNVFKKSRKTSDVQMIYALLMKRLETDIRRWKTLAAFMALNIFITLVIFYMLSSFVDVQTWKIREWSKQLNYTDFRYKDVIGFCSSSKLYWCDTFNKTAKDFGIKLNEIHNTPEENVNEMISRDYEYYREKVVLGIEENRSLITIWYLNQAPHSLPIGFNIVYNFLLKQLTNNSDAKIQASIHTLPTPSQSTSRSRLALLDRTMFIAPYVFVYSLLFAACSSSILLTRERFTKAKLLQYLSGATPLAYWASNITYDSFFFFVISIPFWLVSFFFPKNIVFFNTITVMALFVSFIGLLLSNASVNFLVSQIFTKPSTAFVVLFLFNAISSTVVNEFFFFTKGIEQIKVTFIGDTLVEIVTWITTMSHFRLFVEVVLDSMKATLTIDLCSALDDEDRLYIEVVPSLKDCDSKCKDCYNENYNPFRDGHPGILFEIIWMFVIFLGSSLVSYTIEMRFKKHDCCTESRPSLATDYDVKMENESVDKLAGDDNKEESKYLFLCHRLSKTFKGLPSLKQLSFVTNPKKMMTQFTAVNQLSFTVNRNEFFGLLGVNGAGKSTTFRMLTGDLIPSSGNAYLSPYSLLDNFREYQQEIGYCPQQNVLLDHLTGRQTLKLFARIRGISEKDLSKTVEDLLQFVDLGQYSDKTTTFYSGGNMRKLSLAIALVGCPTMLMLDEPTSGVDPFGRRRLWTAITTYKTVNSGSVILSSHSLDECEALCNRIAILARGTLQCIGSIQHLKSKFCQGYSVNIKSNRKKQNLEQVNAVIKETFPDATVIDEHFPCVVYLIPNAQLTISSIFEAMEKIKLRLDLEDYQVSQMTLEQLFLKFSTEAAETHIESKVARSSSNRSIQERIGKESSKLNKA